MSLRWLRYRGFLLAAAVALAVVATFVFAPGASADSPHAGLDFSLSIDADGDTDADCGTDGSLPAKCAVDLGETFRALVYLNSLGGLPGYGGFDLYLGYTGVSSKGNADTSAWPDCGTNASKQANPGFVVWACAIAPLAPESTYTGLVGTLDFNCTSSGTVSLVHGYPGFTDLVQATSLEEHDEGFGEEETLTVNCLAPPVGGISRDASAAVAPAARAGASDGFSDALLLAGLGAVAFLLSAGGAYTLRRVGGRAV